MMGMYPNTVVVDFIFLVHTTDLLMVWCERESAFVYAYDDLNRLNDLLLHLGCRLYCDMFVNPNLYY